MQSCSLGYALLSGGTISLLPFIFRRQKPDLGRQLGLQISGHLFCGALALAAMPFFGFETGGLAFLGVSSLSELALAFAGAFLPAVFSMYSGLASCGASTFFPAAAGAAIFFGLLWSLVFGNRPPKLAWLGAFLAALSIWLLHASGGR
jgi:hypothetical protein